MIELFRLKKGDRLPERLNRRAQPGQEDVRESVREILAQVRARGDEALFEYTRRFDGVELQSLKVTQEEIDAALGEVPRGLLEVIRASKENILRFHEKQREKSWIDFEEGRALGQLLRPIERVGLYVPGGSAPLASSVLMNALPARVAGVPRLAMATPPGPGGKVHPAILAAAAECGIGEIYKLGGAQAIAALAYGTASVPAVDKIVGPGNVYVASAKREVYGEVGIDMVAGPSEVLVIADGTANPRFVAADLLSQAEHDPRAAAILVTVSPALAFAVRAELERQLPALSRREIAQQSLKENGAILLAEDLGQAFDLANEIAPEHLELCVEDPFSKLGLVKNAGACFLGDYAPEPLGDYFAGPNHVLPTSGTARFFSPLSVQDFYKKTSVIFYEKAAFLRAADMVERFALAEELSAHAGAAARRKEEGCPHAQG
ncbi:MAG: histidinol dehydrogenase [Christensenellaceae bacterium]|jgi:histidinol dehydrogenase|nr:histidinol dehydrogenase [Christensenellaceae bacterium]